MKRWEWVTMATIWIVIAVFVFTKTTKSSSVEDEGLIVLSENNTVNLNLPIDENSAKITQTKLLEISDNLGKNKPIYLVLNTPGGSVVEGQHIIDLAKGLPQKVHTISLFSASMGFVISQELDNRYVLADSTLMSHHAYVGGIPGEVPGSAMVRLQHLLDSVTQIENDIAKRAGYSLKQYEDLIQNELWVTGPEAVDMRFADKLVRVRCDSSLRGPAEAVPVDFFFGSGKVAFHKCPLITTPMSVEGNNVFSDYFHATRDTQFRIFQGRN